MRAGPHRAFDSWAILALLQNEPSAPRVRSLITEAHASDASRWITTVNLGEVWYTLARRCSQPEADVSLREVLDLGFQVQDIDWRLARQAANFKSRFPIAYADCFAAALAKLRDSELVTGDPEFKCLEKEIKIYWL